MLRPGASPVGVHLFPLVLPFVVADKFLEPLVDCIHIHLLDLSGCKSLLVLDSNDTAAAVPGPPRQHQVGTFENRDYYRYL